MSEDDLKALCCEWQEVLRLRDWDVRVRVAKPQDMTNHSRVGECDYSLSNKEAVVRVLHPDYHSDNALFPCDTEVTLVHELLHLHFAPFDADDGLEQVAQEQAIESIAKALVTVKRRRSDTNGKAGHES